MKNTMKVFGIIALVAVITFSTAACGKKNKGGGGSGGDGGADVSGVDIGDAMAMAKNAGALADAASKMSGSGSDKKDKKGPVANNLTSNSASDYKYDLSKDYDGIKITEYTGKASKINIPAKIEDMPVVEIGGKFLDSYWLSGVFDFLITSITIPNTVKKIDGYDVFGAFKSTDITSITLPNGLIEIGPHVFAGTKLTSITIPNSVTTIGKNAFSGSGITRITLPDSVTKIEYEVFRSCEALTEVRLSDNLTEIPNDAFVACRKLQKVNLPKNLKKIGNHAFQYCEELTELTIPDSITSLEIPGFVGTSEAFKGCGRLPIKTRQRLKELGYTGEF